MGIICWRFDDLNFAEEMQGIPCHLHLQKKIVSVFTKNSCKITFALITRYKGKDYRSNPDYLSFLHELISQGHEIAAHSTTHQNWQQFSEEELEIEIKTMRNDFDQMKIPTRTFVFPGLQTNWKSLPILKKYGFHILIKGENYNVFKRAFVMLKNRYYTKKYDIDFFLPHTFSTEQSYSPPLLNLPMQIPDNKATVHVMDHIWLYKKQDINALLALISSSKQHQWLTVSSVVEDRNNNYQMKPFSNKK